MSMQPKGSGEIPAETVRVARAAFPKGSLAIRVRDELGPLFRDEEFADLFPARGRPAWSPGGLALLSVLQFVEGLTDRQAAEAVRARIDFKYALGLEKRLLKSAGRARTDSTHVLSAARELCWLEMVAETLRAALNALAQAAPAWLSEVAEPEWFGHYATRADDTRFPVSRVKREEVGMRIGRDGTRLLAAVFSADAPAGLRGLAEVETLRQMWVQHFHQVDGEVRRRDPKDRPPGALRLVTPYDTDARGSVKRDTVWHGYKVHFTETCEPDAPNLITNVATTASTVQDRSMAEIIHHQLAARDCLPAEHWVDAGYPTAPALVSARRDHGIALHGPVQTDNSAQTRAEGGFGQDVFTIDWDNQQAACPGGRTSTTWSERLSQRGQPVLRVVFSASDCRPCTMRQACINTPNPTRPRELRLRRHDEHHALQAARAEQQTDAWKDRYKVRAGVEGTMSQAVQRCGLRRSRYRGLAKTSLQHQLTGAAINLARIDAHLTETPRARTRTSHFAALRPAELILDGAK